MDGVMNPGLLPPRSLDATECEGLAVTTEDTPYSRSLPPADAEMLVPDGPPKVRFLRPEFRMFLKLIHCITARHTGESTLCAATAI